MEKNYFSKSFTKNIALMLFTLLLSFNARAQSEPFLCDFNAYLFQYNDIYALDLASGSSYLVAENVTPGNVNGVGYNSTDGYIWGYLSSPQKTIVRIGKDFQVQQYTFPELTTNNKYVGDISIDGIYYFKGGGTSFYKIDLNPDSETYLQYLGEFTLSKNLSIADWAFNAADNKLYTVERNSNHLYRIDPDTGVVTDLGEVPILKGLNYAFGAVYFDVDGNFYISANQTGSVYKINEVQSVVNGIMFSNIFAFGPAASSNDGARCPTAPVPQEDCINGIDDDGDGLVDCDDPSCSGVSACPVITITSGGNTGGLESNDRLANLIIKRNYNRAKTNYKFDKLLAKKVKKTINYKKSSKTSPSEIPLNSLVPLGIVGETSTIESSPADLLELTNASDIYSVDYLKDTETVSALMVIKTDNKVYEHSKFICDRFLGAELLSVSTIQIREKDFIKSRIKQADGNIEFALTFSARLDENQKFVIESHWNIDKYEDNTMYYNFQVWSNSIDDLVSLGEEILDLLEANAEITDYTGSTPPPVFVKSASYKNGKINMHVVNNNNTKEIFMDGGLKRTETGETTSMSLQASIDGYIDSVAVNTGSLFDFGFRIENSNGDTPDDLFVADAPWGLDDSGNGTMMNTYEVLQNEIPYTGDGFRVERNIKLSGSTKDYIGVYRAFSPRFLAVDLSEYKNLSFEASGTGTLEVKLQKGNGEEYISEVQLEEESQIFTMPDEVFKNSSGDVADFSSLKVLTFILKTNNGNTEEKSLNLSNLDFNNEESKYEYVLADTKKAVLMPNPIETEATLYFFEEKDAKYTFEIYTVGGHLLSSHTLKGDTQQGQNEIVVYKRNLPTGIYLYKITSTNDKTWSGKMVIR
ncbi:putative secreted protein (Por secretion system target) [Maribacter vaceletii]|uniref:Putative secreted protein (Por secretion system target) n=1 Tax=Maribacter vaceletii TaxID=1206816 RepID=A0A495E9N2_9FLAO|nr:T9SS type A sorting domain-containing protein [Maribacter vaceletii]RKR13496.1 putative secreted protein (Por secretion system target) [Maribacter vaceletii]